MAASTGASLTQTPAAVTERAALATAARTRALVSVGGIRPRLALGVVVVVGVVALQLASDAVSGKESARLLARLVYMACELPLLMIALTAAFRRSIHGSVTAARGLALGATIATAFGCVFGFAYGGVAMHVPALRLHYPNGVSLMRTTLFGVLNAQMYFGLWSLVVAYPFAVESARIRAHEAARLRSEAEVARLRAHLEPHFLLNTLNAIAGLVTDEPREARRLLSCLGDLLRDAVQDTGEVQTLHRQVAWLRRYGQILEARHRGALTLEWDIAPEAAQILLPRFLLQPLVENAVKHGALRRSDRDGRVVVRAHCKPDGTLVCVVEDNGPGMPDADVDVREGAFGLHAVRRRLALEVPNASLRHESSSQGTLSIVEMRPTPLEV